MVLTLRRAVNAAALMLLAGTTILAQQGRGRGVGGTSGERGLSIAARNLAISGKARPVLYGFALECTDCQPRARARIVGGGNRGRIAIDTARSDGMVTWLYTSYPRVVSVAPGGVAESAGVREGDVLMSIDGLSLLSEAGARRFASASSGDEVRLTFERDSKPIDVTLMLAQPRGALGRGRGGALKPSFPTMVLDGSRSARYAGTYDNIDLQIWSDEPVIATRDSTGAMILRTGRTIVRLKSDSVGSGASGSGGRARGGRGGRGQGTPDE